MGNQNSGSADSERVCANCKQNFPDQSYYKYELKKAQSTCIACVKAQRKNKKTETSEQHGVYVITTMEHMKKNMFKFGKHTGTQRKLLSRYKTYLINPIIILYLPQDDMHEFENRVLTKLSAVRIHDDDGGNTEWVHMPLLELMHTILDI
jgi:hypothetical protein